MVFFCGDVKNGGLRWSEEASKVVAGSSCVVVHRRSWGGTVGPADGATGMEERLLVLRGMMQGGQLASWRREKVIDVVIRRES